MRLRRYDSLAQRTWSGDDPKNHRRPRVDLSYQLTAALRLWRRQQRSAWLAVGRPCPEWVFSSVMGTALDESNVRNAFNRILDDARVHRRGPHQMRHPFASLLFQEGAPITYVSQQLGRRDASITLRTGCLMRRPIRSSTDLTTRHRTSPRRHQRLRTKKFSGC